MLLINLFSASRGASPLHIGLAHKSDTATANLLCIFLPPEIQTIPHQTRHTSDSPEHHERVVFMGHKVKNIRHAGVYVCVHDKPGTPYQQLGASNHQLNICTTVLDICCFPSIHKSKSSKTVLTWHHWIHRVDCFTMFHSSPWCDSSFQARTLLLLSQMYQPKITKGKKSCTS